MATSMATRPKGAAKAELVAWFKDTIGLKEGETVYFIVRRVARSGMRRTISLFVWRDRPWILDRKIADLLGMRLDKRHWEDGVVIRGCGMNMGAAIVTDLAYAVFGSERALRYEMV